MTGSSLRYCQAISRILRASALLAFVLAATLLLSARAADVADPADRPLDTATNLFAPPYQPGAWIWDSKTYDGQGCQFLKVFEVPKYPALTRARILMTADDKYTVLLDGRVLGRGWVWQHMDEYDVTDLLQPGTHVLAVQAFNELDEAGLLFGLFMDMADGKVLAVRSDNTWVVAPPTREHWITMTHPPATWPKATVKRPFGFERWWGRPPSIIAHSIEEPVTVPFWQAGWFQVTLVALIGAILLVCFRLAAQLAFHRKAQALLQLERARIARDIHDDLGAGLTQLVLLGEVARNELPPDFSTRAEIDQICEKARDLSRNLSEVLWAVNSRHDTLPDFATHAFKYAQSFLQNTPIRCRLDLEPSLPSSSFDLPIRRNLFLAVKEALNNVAKHSKAGEVFLRIHRAGPGVVVQVEDNGQGFDPSSAGDQRNGLGNMQERMREIGGQCRITAHKGGGSCVEFSIPVIHASGQPSWLARLFRRRSKTGEEDPARQIIAGLSGAKSAKFDLK